MEQDAGHLLRLEFHHDGGSTRLFAAAITGGGASVLHWSAVPGGAPKYLRLKRAGNEWTVSYSSNGANWTTGATFTHAMTVSAMGPLAGNGGSPPPAFTSAVDHFREVLPDGSPPLVSGVSSTPQTISATVAWTTNELATSKIAYGPTSAYEFGTLSTAGSRTSHSLLVHGLRCATTYHFQIRSVDLSGNEAASPDGTFTTAACPASLTSDEFNAATLDTSRWVWIDPLGDSSASSTGSQARIAVPAGTRHDLWTGVDEVPRLLQATPDADFEVEVKFDSPVTTRYQMQGLFVQQDARNLLRIEVHHEGSGAYLFVAGLTNGTASVIHERSRVGHRPRVPAAQAQGLDVDVAALHRRRDVDLHLVQPRAHRRRGRALRGQQRLLAAGVRDERRLLPLSPARPHTASDQRDRRRPERDRRGCDVDDERARELGGRLRRDVGL